MGIIGQLDLQTLISEVEHSNSIKDLDLNMVTAAYSFFRPTCNKGEIIQKLNDNFLNPNSFGLLHPEYGFWMIFLPVIPSVSILGLIMFMGKRWGSCECCCECTGPCCGCSKCHPFRDTYEVSLYLIFFVFVVGPWVFCLRNDLNLYLY